MERIIAFSKKLFFGIFFLWFLGSLYSFPVFAANQEIPQILQLNHGWQYYLGSLQPKSSRSFILSEQLKPIRGWVNIPDLAKPPAIPTKVHTVWYRIHLPKGNWVGPCIYFESIYAQSLSFYIDWHKIYEEHRYWDRNENKIIIPLNQNHLNHTLYIRVISNDVTFGPRPNIYLGNQHDLIIKSYQDGFINIVLGFALAFLAGIMLFCSIFLDRELKKSWISLSFVIFILGIAEAIYPNKISFYYPVFDRYAREIVDIVKYTMFPTLTYFLEQLFGTGYKSYISWLRKFQISYAICGLCLMVLNYNLNFHFRPIYNLFSGPITGIFCIIQFILLIVTLSYFSFKGNSDARLFNIGFLIFAFVSSLDILRFFLITNENPFSFWKWGLLAFVICLICILGRRIADYYRKVVKYSSELELKNQVLDSMWQEIKNSRDQLAELNKSLEERVIERTQQLAETNLELTVVNQELSRTNSELIQTMDILQKTQAQLIESEKLAALGQLIAGITHEINTPFGAIQASINNISESLNKLLEELLPFYQKLPIKIQDEFLNLLRLALQNSKESITSREERQLRKSMAKQLDGHHLDGSEEHADMLVAAGIYDIEPHLAILSHSDSAFILRTVYIISGLQRNLKIINTAAERTSKVVFALKSYTHQSQSHHLIQADIIQGIETILTLYQSKIKNNVNVICNYQDIPPIMCYPDELNQVWTNVIDNALHAMKYRGTLEIDVFRAGDYIHICFTDNGPGIPPELTDKIFHPFFTTKPQGEGSGMGLDIVKKIIEKHRGKIKLESTPGRTMFTFNIPVNPV